MKALEKDRDRRYETADGLAEDVQRYLADEPVEARPPSAGYRLRKFVRRNRAAGGRRGGLRAVAGGRRPPSAPGWPSGLAGAAGRRRRKRGAKANEGDARSSEAEAQAVLEFFQNRILAAARPKGRTGGLGPEATIRAAVDAAEPQIAKEFAGQPLAEAAIRSALGKTYAYLGEHARAARQYERSVALRRERLPPGHPDLLVALRNLGVAYRDALRPTEAARAYRELADRLEELRGPDHPETLLALNGLASAHGLARRYAEAVALHERVLAQAREKLGPDDLDVLSMTNDLAVVYTKAGRNAEAVALQERVRKQYARGSDRPIPTPLP